MANFRKNKKGGFSLDLTSIQDFAYTLRKNQENVMTEVQRVAEDWSQKAKADYTSKISYANGFNKMHRGKTPFSEVQQQENNALKVSVGHNSFIAKFLEVGTKAHYIPHKTRNGGYATAKVQGIAGTKALSKVFDGRKQELVREIETTVTKLIGKG